MSRLIRRVLLYVLALPFLLVASETEGPSDVVLNEVARSVVKITAGSSSTVHKVGAGFIWPDKNHVVTALHVVDGAGEQIMISYIEHGKVVGSSQAAVERILRESDLVLLRLKKPNNCEALRIDTRPLEEHERLAAVGFPLAAAAVAGTELKRRFGSNVLEQVLPENLKTLWKAGTYPSKDSQVFTFDGHLVKGYSGGPVVDGRGRVVGVGDGGLEGGAASISWAIPAAQLERLLASNDSRLPNNPVVQGLFTADLVDPSNSPAIVETDEVRLARLRTRSFNRLAATADDKPALLSLAFNFQDFVLQSFRYDIYTDLPSGATLAVPAGLRLSAEGGNLTVETGSERVQMLAEIDRIRSNDELAEKIIAFTRKLWAGGDTVVVSDPNWHRSGKIGEDIVLSRGALYGMVEQQGELVRAKCAYVVAAGNIRMSTLLLAAAVDNECTAENLAMEQSCRAGAVHPACPDIVKPRRQFVQLVLGIQFSTFSR